MSAKTFTISRLVKVEMIVWVMKCATRVDGRDLAAQALVTLEEVFKKCSERCDNGPERSDNGPKWSDIGPVRSDNGAERNDNGQGKFVDPLMTW